MDEVKVFKSSCGEFFKDEETCREFEEIKTKGMQELKTKMIFENKISEKTRTLLKSIELNDLPQVLEDISILEKWSQEAVCIVDGRTPFYKGGMHLKNFDELCKKILNFFDRP